jgi:Holliday junction resolvasome RuvABC ATP-dependent DNA helicase subunit
MAKDNIIQFARRHNVTDIDKGIWEKIKNILGILPLGLENTELQILKVLKDKQVCSLTNLSAVTGLSTNAIRAEFELYPLKHSLMEVAQGGRRLTAKGREYLKIIGE